MESFVNGTFYAWMIDLLRAIGEMRNPILDAFFGVITYFGHEIFVIVICMLLCWCINKKEGYRLLYIFMISNLLCQVLKGITQFPRPWVVDPTFCIVESAKEAASGFSFPSAHTMTALVIWLGLALWIKKNWFTVVSSILVLLVAFSRMYLGVHTILDVGFSIVVGVPLLIGMYALLKRTDDRSYGLLLGLGLLASAIFLLILQFSNDPDFPRQEDLKNAYVLVGTTVGFVIGWIIDTKYTRYVEKAPLWLQAVKILVGAGLVFGTRAILKPLFGGDDAPAVLHGVRYAMMSLVALGFYPMLFAPVNRLVLKKQRN